MTVRTQNVHTGKHLSSGNEITNNYSNDQYKHTQLSEEGIGGDQAKIINDVNRLNRTYASTSNTLQSVLRL